MVVTIAVPPVPSRATPRIPWLVPFLTLLFASSLAGCRASIPLAETQPPLLTATAISPSQVPAHHTPSPIPSSTAQLEPQQTPYPTVPLTSQDAINIAEEILSPTACSPPCWNGLRPGLSHASDVQAFFARLGIDVSHEQPFVDTDGSRLQSDWFRAYPRPVGQAPLAVSVRWVNDTVVLVSLSWESGPPDLATPRSLANSLGAPDRILLNVKGGEGIGYEVAFDYPTLGTAILVSGRATLPPSLDEPALACLTPQERPYSTVILYSGDLLDLIYGGALLSDWPSRVGMTTEGLFSWLVSDEICAPLPDT